MQDERIPTILTFENTTTGGEVSVQSNMCTVPDLFVTVPYVKHAVSSGSFEAESSVKSLRKLSVFIIYKTIFWIEISKTYFNLFWKQKHLQ